MPKQKNFKKNPDSSAFKNPKAFRGSTLNNASRGVRGNMNARPRALGGHK